MDPAAKKAKTEEALAGLDAKTEAEAGRVMKFFSIFCNITITQPTCVTCFV